MEGMYQYQFLANHLLLWGQKLCIVYMVLKRYSNSIGFHPKSRKKCLGYQWNADNDLKELKKQGLKRTQPFGNIIYLLFYRTHEAVGKGKPKQNTVMEEIVESFYKEPVS